MKTSLYFSLFAITIAILGNSAQAQTLPIETVFDTVGDVVNQQCNDIIATNMIEVITIYDLNHVSGNKHPLLSVRTVQLLPKHTLRSSAITFII